MKRVLFVIGSLEYGGTARQLTHLAAGLPRERVDVHVGVLGGSSPWAEQLRAAGIRVEILGRTRPFDVMPLWRLLQLVRSTRWDVVHIWGASALRTAALLACRKCLWVSGALTPGGKARWIDRALLRGARRIVAFGETDASRYKAVGVATERVSVVQPAVVPGECETASGATDEFVCLCIGPLLPHKGFSDVVWALDILHHLFPHIRVILVGDARLLPLQSLAHVEKVEIVPACEDLGKYLSMSDVVVVPSLLGGGVNAALEAQAAGKPVVASRLPELMEVVADGVSGSFFTPGDKPELARQLRLFVEDADRRRAFGEAGRRHVAERFPARGLVESYLPLLDGTCDIRA